MKEDRILTADEVAERLAVSKATAYGVIKQLNKRGDPWPHGYSRQGQQGIAGRHVLQHGRSAR